MTLNRIRITQRKKESQRLSFVKALKDVSGYGLKEAKDLADSLNYSFDKTLSHVSDYAKENQNSFIEVVLPGKFASDRTHSQTNEAIRAFIKHLNENCTGSYEVTGGTEWEREMKLLSLGVGVDSDYVNFITRVIMCRDQAGIETFISEHLSTLDRKKLEEIYNKIIKESKEI